MHCLDYFGWVSVIPTCIMITSVSKWTEKRRQWYHVVSLCTNMHKISPRNVCTNLLGISILWRRKKEKKREKYIAIFNSSAKIVFIYE